MQKQIIKDITKYTGLNQEDALTLWNMMLRGVGSDRANKMLKWGKLMGQGSKTYNQYNCDRQPLNRERV